MKRLYLIYFVIMCFFIIFGCAGHDKIRTVQENNIFYSSSTPSTKIKINPDFKLHKETDDQHSGFSSGFGEKSSSQDISKFLFIDKISGKRRAVEIIIAEMVTPNWTFKSNIFTVKDPFDSGNVTIQGENYQYCTHVIINPNNSLLIKDIGRLVGARSRAMIIIRYLEQVTGDWTNLALLSSEQRKQLDVFIEDSGNDIQILEN
jgi:hypothetical protein